MPAQIAKGAVLVFLFTNIPALGSETPLCSSIGVVPVTVITRDPLIPTHSIDILPGEVTVSFTITESGEVEDTTVVETTSPRLNRAAYRTISEFLYRPVEQACRHRHVFRFEADTEPPTMPYDPHHYRRQLPETSDDCG
ncbi:energy transducer TonB [Lentisalinibacter sediminis]|uniref:energy transducer TonB n=1 Tax=Lentisalinibacter sediminis TaxID=2992237 RepID=UPI00386568EC